MNQTSSQIDLEISIKIDGLMRELNVENVAAITLTVGLDQHSEKTVRLLKRWDMSNPFGYWVIINETCPS